MRNSETPYTIFEFIISKLVMLESCFSELNRFITSSIEAQLFCYDPVIHRFRPQHEYTSVKKKDFLSELKFSLEDLSVFPKSIFRTLHVLTEELNLGEAKKVNAELSMLIRIIDESFEQIMKYINTHEIPGHLKQEMTYHSNQIKNLSHECHILEVETSGEDSLADQSLQPLIQTGGDQQRSPEESAALLKKITLDVDNMIRRMPFIVTQDERARLIAERFNKSSHSKS